MLEEQKLSSDIYFPKIRVYGTVGFIVAMWTISLLKLEMRLYQLYISAAASIVLSIFSVFFISIKRVNTSKNKKISCQNIIQLFKKGRVAVFLFFAMLLGSVLQITNTFGVPFARYGSSFLRLRVLFFSAYPTIFLSIFTVF
ncbi:MFS transporter [Providencia hangzhouensis]